MPVTSPLTGSRDVTHLRTISTEKIIQGWKSTFQIDIAHELRNHTEISLYQCNQTELRFFSPEDVAGTKTLYEQLERFEWYYMPQKWEHNAALADLRGAKTVLEVGGGRGAFVQRLKMMNFDAQGIETNPKAVAYAQNRGIPLQNIDLQDLAKEKSGYFDAICSFQVLEHIAQLRQFFSSVLDLLKPKGKLIFAVPNNDSFLKYDDNLLLNQPPHHMTLWNKKVFESLTTLYPIQLQRIRFEPLASYHIGFYLSIQLTRFPILQIFDDRSYRLPHRLLAFALRKSTLVRHSIVGHSLYVCFEKK